MRYTYVRQHDTTDCAAACLAMVCLHYKKEVTITRLRDMMGTDLKGTNLIGLQKAANELGFTTAAVRVDRENFLSDFSLPCIAQVITDQGLAHFVVIFKKTTIKDDALRRKHMIKENEAAKEDEKNGKKHRCKDYVVIGDPGTELKKISLDEFYKNFTGVLLLMNPTSEFKGGKIEKGGMFKRYIDLLLPQKKLFAYAILASLITTVLGIASSMFNKILMDEVLPYGLDNLLVTLILVFSVVSITNTLVGFVRLLVDQHQQNADQSHEQRDREEHRIHAEQDDTGDNGHRDIHDQTQRNAGEDGFDGVCIRITGGDITSLAGGKELHGQMEDMPEVAQHQRNIALDG